MNEKGNKQGVDLSEQFRKEALDQISSPEGVNIPFRPVSYYKSPVLISIGLITFTFILWFVAGSIPLTIEGRGIAMNLLGLFSQEARRSGVVKEILVKPGEIVHKGQLLMRLEDLEKEKQYLLATAKIESLANDVSILRNEIQKELNAQKESIQKQILATKASIQEMNISLPQLEKDLRLKEELFKEHLLGLQQLYEAEQLLSQRKIELATTYGVLATYEANLTKSYREQELVNKEHDLLNTQQERDLLNLDLSNLNVLSEHDGIVLEILPNPGEHILIGSPLIRLEFGSQDKQTFIFYAFISADTGKQIKMGTPVQIVLSTVRAEEYGSIVGKITEISPYPVSREAIGKKIQNQGLVDYLVDGKSNVIQILVSPVLDPLSPSGYHWTSGLGPKIQIAVGTVCVIKGLAGRVSPLVYLVSLWRLKKIQAEIENYYYSEH